MAITRRTDFAIRLMYELAQLPAGASLSARDLCELADVPESFGTSLVPFLTDAGLVRAEGFRNHLLSLARSADQITMGEIIRACEPEFSLALCTRENDRCTRAPSCGVQGMWAELDGIVWRHLDSVTLAQVASGRPLTPELTARPSKTGVPGWPVIS